jgi:hypothetical protein
MSPARPSGQNRSGRTGPGVKVKNPAYERRTGA